MLQRAIRALAIIAVLAPSASAQITEPYVAGARRDTLIVRDSTVVRLEPFIIERTFRLWRNGEPQDATGFVLDSRTGRLHIRPAPDSATVVVAAYRTMPYLFRSRYFKRERRSIPPDSVFLRGFVNPEDRSPTSAAEDPFDDAALERSGSITRGIIAGNNRDVSLESGLRLELSGDIAEGVGVQAVLSDENTPIQPDGTTQQLNEFDRVFIQIEGRQGTATLGDYDLRFSGSTFAPFNRKLQGISLNGEIPAIGNVVGEGEVTVAGATSRGILNVQSMEAIEGVQGPYRLQGKRGEQFIIVIAGSERVYLDGQLMTRGESNDYIIDYATGEITFTSRRIIGEDTRLSVEFEYTTNRFTRTLLGGQASAGLFKRDDGSARLTVSSTYLREADSRAFGQELGLSSADDSLLAEIGDADEVVAGDERLPFDPEALYVQYIKKDTAASEEPVFVAVSDTAGIDFVYRVRFTRVPPGQGSYRRVGRSVNGILFEWVGEGKGDYVPGRLLPKPKRQELVDLTASLEPIKGLTVFGEFAGSILDQNRTSFIDDEDNGGEAFTGGVRLEPKEISLHGRYLGEVSGAVERRRTGARFEAFDRTRPVEFARAWNLNRQVSATGAADGTDAEDITSANLRYALSNTTFLSGEIGRMQLTGFTGDRTVLEGRFEEENLPRISYRLEDISSSDSLRQEQGTWQRHLGNIGYTLWGGRLTPTFEIERENRRLENLEDQSLKRGSLAFTEWRPGLALAFEKIKIDAVLERRSERGLAEGRLLDRARAWTGQAVISLRPGRAFQTNADVGYRAKRFTEFFRINKKESDTESIAVRWTGRASPFRRAFMTNWFYEALTEKTPILQETYVRIGPEIGQYVWEDFNGDGIRQIDEFLPERLPNEGVYTRTFVPSDTLEPVINVQSRIRFSLDPSRVIGRDAPAGLRWLRAIASQTTWEVAEKSKESQLRRIYLLQLKYFDNDSTTVNGRQRFEQRLDLFKGKPAYGVTFVFNTLRTSARRAAGREKRHLGTWRLDARYQLQEKLGARLSLSREKNQSESRDGVTGDLSGSRTFDIATITAHPELSFSPSRNFQVTSGMQLARKTDTPVGGGADTPRGATVLMIPAEVRYNRAGRLQLVGRIERATVSLDGEAVGLAAYELTDGRGPGTSYLWNVFGQYRISSLVNATLTYDGRAPSDAPVIHTVRMQVSVVF